MTANSIAFGLQIIIGIAIIVYLLSPKQTRPHQIAKKRAAKRKSKGKPKKR